MITASPGRHRRFRVGIADVQGRRGAPCVHPKRAAEVLAILDEPTGRGGENEGCGLTMSCCRICVTTLTGLRCKLSYAGGSYFGLNAFGEVAQTANRGRSTR